MVQWSPLWPQFLNPWLFYSTTYQFKTPAALFESLISLFNYLPIQNSGHTLDYSIQLLIKSKLRPHFLNPWLFYSTTSQFKTPAALFVSLISLFNYLPIQNSSHTLDYSIQLLTNSKLQLHSWLFYSTTYWFKTPAALFEFLIMPSNYLSIQNSGHTFFKSLIILFNYLPIQNSGRTFWILAILFECFGAYYISNQDTVVAIQNFGCTLWIRKCYSFTLLVPDQDSSHTFWLMATLFTYFTKASYNWILQSHLWHLGY